MYSRYYAGHVVKFLIGTAPSGAVTFVSDGFPGRITDKVCIVTATHVPALVNVVLHVFSCSQEIVSAAGLLAKVERGDVWMADKGFRIKFEVLRRGGTLLMPTVRARGQVHYDVQEEAWSGFVAQLRIDIEMAIGRVRRFSKLNTRWNLLQLDMVSKVFKICSWLTNYSRPLHLFKEWKGESMAELQWGVDPLSLQS